MPRDFTERPQSDEYVVKSSMLFVMRNGITHYGKSRKIERVVVFLFIFIKQYEFTIQFTFIIYIDTLSNPDVKNIFNEEYYNMISEQFNNLNHSQQTLGRYI